MATMIELIDKFKMAREMLGLSQRDMRGLVDATQGTISQWETGSKYPTQEHQRKIIAWLKQAEKKLNSPSGSDPKTVMPPNGAGHRTTPTLKQQVITRLKEGVSHRHIKAELHVDLHTITNIRHEANIPVKSQSSKQAEHIEQLWNDARNQTRALAPSKLPDADRISFAMALADIRVWLTHYIETNLADALDPKKIREEIKRVLK